MAAPPLDAEARARGRRLAITSHPAGMTHRTVFTDHLPTLALLALGAGETVVGLQRAFEPAGQLLQLPTLRAVGRFTKRSILIGGHVLALVGGVPLLAFGALAASGSLALPLALAALAVTAGGIVISQTVWFPLLRAYQEPGRVGRFFAVLRTGWHVALIVYFLGAQAWLARHPGSFAPLFAFGFACGVLRLFLIARLPERSERTGEAIRVGEALALLRREPLLRRYLLGAATHDAVRTAAIPFAVVWMRRELGFTDGDVMLTTVAFFVGGLVALYPSGRLVDRLGAAPVFGVTALATAALLGGLALLGGAGELRLLALVGFFFGMAALNAGFGLADTHVLFRLAPDDAPSRMIVVAIVVTSLCRAAAPLAVGIALEAALASGVDPQTAYVALFSLLAALELLVFAPLRIFRD